MATFVVQLVIQQILTIRTKLSLDPHRALRGGRALRGRERRTTPSRVVVQRDADEARRAADDGLRRDLVAEDGDGDRDE